MNAASDFKIVPMGARAPDGAAACDGVVPGAAIDLNDWEGNVTPAELKADTSTEIALRFARSGGHVDSAVNNHYDADGALAVYALLRSDVALANADVLIAPPRSATSTSGPPTNAGFVSRPRSGGWPC